MAATTNKQHLQFLDGLRGIAAFVVLVGHARLLLWEGDIAFESHTATCNLGEKLLRYFLLLFNYSHEAVLFFFVLSGFVIHLKYAEKIKANAKHPFDFIAYLFRRMKRIYPPIIAAYILGFALDKFGLAQGYSIYLHQTPVQHINNIIGTNFTLKTLVGNLLFFQNTYVTVWGSNSPLWSLKYEWWFYMLYPILFYVNRKRVWLASLVVIAVFVITQLGYSIFGNLLLTQVCNYLICWWLGTLLADVYQGRVLIKIKHLTPLIILLPLMFCIRLLVHNKMIIDVICSAGFVGLLACLFQLKKNNFLFKVLEKIKWLGNCSYTLYVVHFPILVLLAGIVLHYHNNQMPHTQLYAVAAIIIATSIAYLLHFITERKWTKK